MAIELKHIVLHQVVKQADGQLSLSLSDTELENNQAVTTMLEELHRLYNAKNKAYAVFRQSSDMATTLSAFLQQEMDFLALSRASSSRLLDELAKYPFAEGGVLLFGHYRYIANEYLFIAMLDNRLSLRVDEQLQLYCSDYLDLHQADIVARIDLTQWQTLAESKRYLTFLKGRLGRKVADFFLDFLDAEVGLDPKLENRSLLQAVEDYCQTVPLAASEQQACRQQVYDYCQQQHKQGEEIQLQAIAETLPNDQQGGFSQFTAQQDYQLAESFPADSSTLRQLTKFSGSGGGVTLSFDAKLLGEKVLWDEATQSLTIKGIPPNLQDQLQRRRS